MTILQIFFIISGLIISILAIEVSSKQKFNALHFVVFFLVGGGLLVFTLFPKSLDALGRIFGIQRGADLLVYTSIIFIFYFILLLLRKTEENSTNTTELIRELALANRNIDRIKGREAFVIPSYNEGEVISHTIEKVLKAGYNNIIIVNDGSSDNTREIVKKYEKKVVILTHYKNRGQGAALETGFEFVRRYANIEYVVTFDADGQHDILDVKTFEKYLLKHPGVEILLGSRFLGTGKTSIPFSRRIILKLGIIFTFFLSKIHLSDTHNGFRVIRKETLSKIKLSIDGMGHASELLDIVAAKKITFREVPVNIQYSEYSLKKGQSSGNAMNIGLRFIWNKFFR